MAFVTATEDQKKLVEFTAKDLIATYGIDGAIEYQENAMNGPVVYEFGNLVLLRIYDKLSAEKQQ